MPIEYRIDHDHRLVIAKGEGTLRDRDVFDYQRDVWSRADVAGYDELVDMSGVKHIKIPSSARVKDLADLAADMDPPQGSSKFAIVAPTDLAFGLGRMFEIYRGLNPRSNKQVAVFRTMKEALSWLGAPETLG